MTEKSTIQKESANQVTFEVNRKANRVEIKKAVEDIFKVKVSSVKTIQVMGKFKRRGRILGKRNDYKKAIVKLMPGERIEFFEGV
ncbi:MAG: 50S ribosomal protein L23 [Desulfobacterium sp.]|nr:50S ribosomal protein L23 [Desulfobacterium sp.]